MIDLSLLADAYVTFRDGITEARKSVTMRALISGAEKVGLVEVETLDWAAHCMDAKVKEEARQVRFDALFLYCCLIPYCFVTGFVLKMKLTGEARENGA